MTRVRFAPSPTGSLHVGNALSAVANRDFGEWFLLRVDDTDAARNVPDRLARDFWVKPSEKMVRLWCRAYAAEFDFDVDYQPWVVANFSGILWGGGSMFGSLAPRRRTYGLSARGTHPTTLTYPFASASS